MGSMPRMDYCCADPVGSCTYASDEDFNPRSVSCSVRLRTNCRPLTLAWHPDLGKIVAVPIPPKRKPPPILTVSLPGGLDQHQVLLLGGLGLDERKITRCLQ